MRTIKINELDYQYLKRQAAKEGRFLWVIVQRALMLYQQEAAATRKGKT